MNEPLSIAILKPGTFTSVDGSEHSYSEADLAATAAAYDSAKDPAPLVIGHPALDAPAYGWVQSMAVEGGELVAHVDPASLEPAFAEAVRSRRYAKVSASLYPPQHKANPTPGVWGLKHVGFLGAHPPGVKGLGTVKFAECEGLITLETTNQENEMSDQDRTAEFAERDAELTRREQELQGRETSLAARETAVTEAAAAARHEANVAFAEALVETGKLAPAGKELVIGVMDGLDGETAVSFGEANGDLTPLAGFKKLLEGAGTIVAFGEHARPKAGDDQDANKDPSAIADRAAAYAEEQRLAGKVITIAAAVRHVMKHPD